MSCKQWDAYCAKEHPPYDPGLRYKELTLNERIERLVSTPRTHPTENYSWVTDLLLEAA
jgi:hypothetical protein